MTEPTAEGSGDHPPPSPTRAVSFPLAAGGSWQGDSTPQREAPTWEDFYDGDQHHTIQRS